jgi:hypothetical protein
MTTKPSCIDFPDDADAHVAAVWPFFGQFVAHDITLTARPADAPRLLQRMARR